MTSSPDILLIEDNDQNAYLVRFLLEKDRMTVRRASTGREGLNAAKAEPPDVVLLDIQLPDLDGYELAALLRKEPSLARVPILAVTSFALPAERDKAFAAGCDGYIEKPIAPLKLAEQVRAFLNRA